uniref:Uncharacterized protein n=1 Tax=Labrus bergylta TaxID=56723 RepID=A0A3Q3MYW7_9LABR
MSDTNVTHLPSKITAKNRARQLPDVLVVVEHKQKSSIYLKTHRRRMTETHGQHTRQITVTEAAASRSITAGIVLYSTDPLSLANQPSLLELHIFGTPYRVKSESAVALLNLNLKSNRGSNQLKHVLITHKHIFMNSV